MNRDTPTPETAVGRFLDSLAEPGVSSADVDRSADRMLRFLKTEYQRLPQQRLPVWDGGRRSYTLRWVAVVAVAMVLGAGLMLLRVDTRTIASVESGIIKVVEKGEPRTVGQGGRLSANASFRVGDVPATVSLADGSRVELSAGSSFSAKHVSDGIELRLDKGKVIVIAEKQKSGHLYVRTPDCAVSVTGTVFSVRAEEIGSRVSVFEGEVRVVQRGMSYTLSRGEQLATSPVLGAPGLEAEIQWSPNAAAVLALLQAPEPPAAVLPGTESIEGIVTNVATGAPLGGVTVFVTVPRSPRPLAEVKSGNDGRFKIEKALPGVYKFVASLDGYWATSGPEEVQLGSGQAIRGVRLGMTQVATLSGRVVDENGQPVRSESLALWRLEAQRIVRLATDAGAAGGVTNDKGEYEFANVLPGKYYIRTMPKSSPDAGIYYPGTLNVENALPIELAAGSALTGMNFTLPTVKLYSIRFKIPKESLQWIETIYSRPGPTQGLLSARRSGPSGVSFTNALFEQVSTAKVALSGPPGFTLRRLGTLVEDKFNPLQPPGASRLTSLGNDEYILNGVPAGKYHLGLSWNGFEMFEPQSDGRYIQSRARVDADVEIVDKDVDLGRLESKPGNLSLPVHFTYADGSPSEVAIRADSTDPFGGGTLLNSLSPTLRLNTLRQGSYTLQFTLAKPDRYISVARYAAQDALSGPLAIDAADHGALEVVVDGPAGSAEGIVRDAKGETVAGVSVVLIPAPYRRANRSLFQSARTDQEGKFRFPSLSPGDYGVYSWESAPTQAYFDADWLREYETRGTAVTVRKGQISNANVRLIPARR